MTKSKAQEIKAGECPCGLPIMIAARYAVALNGPTTLRRKCQGYRCGRTNEIVIRASFEVQRATWAAHQCRCGSTLYLRGEYAGPDFEGYSGEHERGVARFFLPPDSAYRNRTVKLPCPRCDCRYVFVIRFGRDPEDNRRTRDLSIQVQRCAACKNRAPVTSQTA